MRHKILIFFVLLGASDDVAPDKSEILFHLHEMCYFDLGFGNFIFNAYGLVDIESGLFRYDNYDGHVYI